MSISYEHLKKLFLCHITIGEFIGGIAKSKYLKPNFCGIFNDNLTYFSYGNFYYKPSNIPTQDKLKFPIALAFSPEILDENIWKIYPFDTGALSKDFYGEKSEPLKNNIENYYIKQDPRKIVASFYQNNKFYLEGTIIKHCPSKNSYIKELYEFLSEDYSSRGADLRQRTIECISREKIDLLKYLRWVAYPPQFTEDIAQLWDKSQNPFDYYSYQVDERENPSELVTYISKEFKKKFNYQFLGPGGRLK